jgi:hypothetical protein
MRKRIQKLRGTIITKGELIADLIFLVISALISLAIIFLFDIHRSFYEWPIHLTFLFKTPFPYILFTFIGTIIGFFVIKLFLLGMKEEKEATGKLINPKRK